MTLSPWLVPIAWASSLVRVLPLWPLSPILGTKKEHKPKLLSPDIFWWGRGLPREGVGAKKVWHVPRNQGNQAFRAGYPRILLGYPGGARKV